MGFDHVQVPQFVFAHYVWLFLAGVGFASTNAQAFPSGALMASVENAKSEPTSTAPSSATAETSEKTSQVVDPSDHLSTEARIIHQLHRRGTFW
jgi:heme-binding NEAT domain protein